MITMDEFLAESKRIQTKREKYPLRAAKDEVLGFVFELASIGRSLGGIGAAYLTVELCAAEKYRDDEIRRMAAEKD